jgi:hypothetical protein
MPTPTVLTFEYIPEEEVLMLSGDLVTSWDEKSRCIAHISLYELGRQKRAFRSDVRNMEERYASGLNFRHDPEPVYEVLEELYMAGRSFWRALSDNGISWLGHVGEFLAQSLPGEWWSAPDPYALANGVYHIATKGPPEALLPLDALPLGIRDSLDIAQDETDVIRLASLFGGFRSIVRHSPLAVGTYLHPPSHGEQATLYLRSVDVEGYEKMSKILNGANAAFIGPFPSQENYHRAGNIARAMIIPEPALGANPVIPDLVQIHAHAEEGDSLSEKLRITFDYGPKEGEFLVVRSSHIEAVDEENVRLRSNGISVGTGPLVVFNACEALGTIGNESLSSGLDLSKFGSRAVIGPREEILADFAVEFSNILHEELNKGNTIGEAAVAARWATLTDYLNPSGLIYATFGDVESRRNLPALKI